MDNKKIVAVSVLAVLALAFAGYGYAEYTASTYNAGNDIATNYIKVTPDVWDAMTNVDKVEIDSWTYNAADLQNASADAQDESKTVYAFTADSGAAEVTGNNNYNYAVELGSITLTLTGAATQYDDYKMTVTNTGTISNNGEDFILYMVINDEEYKVGVDDIEDVVVEGPVTVSLVLGATYDVDEIPVFDDFTGGSSKAPASAKILEDVTFIFKFVGNTLSN